MPHRFRRNSFNFEYIKRVNTDNTPFSTILYFFRENDNMLIEFPDKSEVYFTNSYQIKKFIEIKRLKTPWSQNIDGSYFRLRDNYIDHVLPFHKGGEEFVNLTIVLPWKNKDSKMVRTIREDHFKVYKDTSRQEIFIKVSLPIWELWGSFSKLKHASTFSLNKIFMQIDGKFYRFPYGNVNSSDNICLGNSKRDFKRLDQIYPGIITSEFNTDYGFNVKPHKLKDEGRIERNRGEVNSSSLHVITVPTFDLDHINMQIQLKNFNRIGFIDYMYFLSNLETLDDSSIFESFLKVPKMPWEEEENLDDDD